jgi:SulP family sulfate permease
MSEWREFVHLCKTEKAFDIIILVLTFVLTVAFDLVVAIAVGMVLVTAGRIIAKIKNKQKA